MVKLFPEARRSLSHLFRHGWAPTKKQEEEDEEAFFGILRRPRVPPSFLYGGGVSRYCGEGRKDGGKSNYISWSPAGEGGGGGGGAYRRKKHRRQEESFIKKPMLSFKTRKCSEIASILLQQSYATFLEVFCISTRNSMKPKPGLQLMETARSWRRGGR